MKKPVALIAVKDCEVKSTGQSIKAGEVFEASPVDASLLVYHSQAKFAPKRLTETRDLKAEQPTAKRRGRPRHADREYQRRDLVPEP